MSLYPSLEDMKVHQLSKVQLDAMSHVHMNQYTTQEPGRVAYPNTTTESNVNITYPSLGDFMGLELSEAVIAANMPEYSQAVIPAQPNQVVLSQGTNRQLVAPISGQSLGLQRAQVTHGIRELTLCKDKDNKVGLRVKPIDNGIFVCLVVEKSPAALAGLRFGDQILQINGINVAGFKMQKVHDLFNKSPVNGISVAVRDRPFERTITMHKDSTKHVGFQFKNGKIIRIVKDSSAARNGVLINHQLLEINGQNVVGLKDKDVLRIIDGGEAVLTITVIPSYIYDHMVKKMAGSLVRDLMDHSIPDI